MIELFGDCAEGNQKRLESANVFLFTDGIYSKIPGSHTGKEFILIINNDLKLAYQLTHLFGKNSQFILGGIGYLYIQISLRYSRGSALNFEDWVFDSAYDYHKEVGANQIYDHHHANLKNYCISVKS